MQYGIENVLTENQAQFASDAQAAGLQLHHDSGPGMRGERCPAVYVARLSEGDFTSACLCRDSLGKGFVLYARF